METLALIHVPKTAGISMTHAVRQMFGPHNVFHAGQIDRTAIFRDQFDTIRGYQVYAGHMAYRTMRKHLPDARFYAVARQPVARAASLYKHITTTPHHPDHAAHVTLTFLDHLRWLEDNPDKLKNIRQSHFVAGGLDRINLFRVQDLQAMLDEIAWLYARPQAIADRLNARPGDTDVGAQELGLIETLYQPDFELWDLAGRRARERMTLTGVTPAN